MKLNLRIKVPRQLALLAAGAAMLMTVAGLAQGDAFSGLANYDYQDRTAVLAVRGMIDAAGKDRSRLIPIENGLIAVLESSTATFAGRQEATRLLWMTGIDRSIPELAKMLADQKLNNLARYQLERNPNPAAAKALRSALHSAEGPALVGIVNSVGDRGDKDAVDDLKRFTSNTDALVSEAAITALGKIGTDNAVRALQSLPADNLPAGQALLRAAQHMARTNRAGAAEAVYLRLAGQGRPPVVQAGALAGLGNIGSPRAGAAALLGLKSPDEFVQSAAAHVAGSLADPGVTQAAIAAWPALPAPAQVVLLNALAERHEAAALPLALQAMTSPDALLRTTSILAASRTGGAAVVSRLADLASQQNGDGQSARDALALMPGADVDAAILDAAVHGKPEVRSALMGVLAQRPTPTVNAALLQFSNGADSKAAVESLKALGKIGSGSERTSLIKLLASTGDEDVRDAAKDAVLGITQRVGDNDAAAGSMSEAMAGAPNAGKAALLSTLAQTGGNQALAELARAASDADPQVKMAAINALADSWSDSRPLPLLLDAAKRDTTTGDRVHALQGYLRLLGQDASISPDDKVARLAQALAAAERTEEKTRILGILRNIRTPQSLDMAAKLLDDPALLNEAASTVIYLAAPQKKNNQDQVAVKGPATNAALDKIIRTVTDENIKAQAQKMR